MSLYYDRAGKPIDHAEWIRRFRPNADQVVAQTTSNDPQGRKHQISTVWLGLNHNWSHGLPLIFETMVFCHLHDCKWNEEQYRYSTEESAAEGHRLIVERIVSGVGPEDGAA